MKFEGRLDQDEHLLVSVRESKSPNILCQNFFCSGFVVTL